MKLLHDVSSMAGRSYIICGGSFISRKDYIDGFISDKNSVTCVLDSSEKNLSVDRVRVFLAEMDYSTISSVSHRFYVIYGADTLSVIVQNTLLKRLEELPSHTIFFLECFSPDSLLPTIVSRSCVVRLPNASMPSVSLDDLFQADLAHLFVIAEQVSGDAQQANDLLIRIMSYVRSVLAEGNVSSSLLGYLEFLLQCHDQLLHTQTSSRLILENVVLGFYSLFSSHTISKVQ